MCSRGEGGGIAQEAAGGGGGEGDQVDVLLAHEAVVGQVAVACMLLVGAGVLFTSFRRLLAVDTGFSTSVVTGAISLPSAGPATL